MTLPCDLCKKDVVKAKDSVKCANCGNSVAHRSCASRGIKNNEWVCKACRQDLPGPSRKGSVADSDEDNSDVPPKGELAAMEARLTAALKKHTSLITTETGELKNSLQFLSEKYDELLKEVGEQKKQNVELKKALENVAKKLEEKDATINQLTARINQLEQANLSLNLEIHNIPREANENLQEKLNTIAQQVGAPPVQDTVCDMFRAPDRSFGGQVRVGPIVIKFKQASARLAWLVGRKRLAQMRQPGEQQQQLMATAAGAAAATPRLPRTRGPPPVRVYEMLTHYNRRLLFLTKAAAVAKDFKYVWTRDGKVFARKNDQLAALVRIRCEQDIRVKMGHNVGTTDC